MPNRPTRGYIEFKNLQGLSTKAIATNLDPSQLTVAENVDFFKRYGGTSKAKGSTRVLSEVYTEGQTVKPISWVGFYKFLDYNGEQLRKTLIATGTAVNLIKDDGTLTCLRTGRTSGLAATHDLHGRFMLIQNQNPLLIGNGDDPIKYDGHEISDWGLRKPGSDITVLDAITQASDWSVDVSGAPATAIATETTTTRDGASIKVTQGNGDTFSSVGRVITTFNASTRQADRVELSLYVDPIKFDDLRTTSDAVRVFFSSDGSLPISNNFYRFDFDVGDLSPGWNILSFDFTSAPTEDNGTSTGELDTSSIKSVEFQVFGATTSSGVIVYWDRLIELNDGILTPTFADTSGSVFGNSSSTAIWKYSVTFVSKLGLESNAGDAESADNRGGANTYASIALSDIPTSANSTVVSRRIYRTVAGGSVPLLLTTIRNNVTTTYTDTTPDGSLGTATPPRDASITKDNGVPPKAGIVKVWKRTTFLAGDPENPNILVFSRDDLPESFPLINSYDLESRITGIFETALGLIVCTERTYWRVLGVNPNFDVEKVIVGIGAVGARSTGISRHVGWAMDEDGVRLYDLQTTYKISELIRDKFDDITRSTITDAHTHHLTKDNAMFFFNKDSSGNYTNIFVWQYVLDTVSKGQWSTMSLPGSVNILDAQEVEDVNGDTKLYAGADDGMVYELWANSATTWATAGGSDDLTTRIIHPYVRPGILLRGDTFSGRCLPTMIEVQAEGDACTWTATLEMSEGPVSGTPKDSQDVTLQFGTNNTLIRERVRVQQGTDSANNLHPFEWFRLTMTNAQAVNSTLHSVRVWFEMSPGQFLVNTVDNS